MSDIISMVKFCSCYPWIAAVVEPDTVTVSQLRCNATPGNLPNTRKYCYPAYTAVETKTIKSRKTHLAWENATVIMELRVQPHPPEHDGEWLVEEI